MNWLKKFFKFREKSDGDVIKPFLEHMEDLRWTIIKMIGSLAAGMGVAFYFVTDMMNVLRAPLHKVSPTLADQLVTNGVTEAFMISIEMAFFAGLVLSLPFLLYFLATFILPALTRKEKRFLFPGILASTLLFIAGSAASYFYILPKTLKFFYDYANRMQLRILWSWKDYFSFAAWLTIGLGLLCQLPVLVIVLSVIGLIDYKFLARTRPYAIIVILIIAAIIAPTPDPMTFLTLGAPVIALYEACIWIVWLLDRRRAKRARADQERLDGHNDDHRD
jgi:sec-independent protein translocase protein TatC